MWPVSAVFLDALRYSHVMVTTMDVYNVDAFGTVTRVLSDIPVTDGSVSCSRTSKTRRTLNATIVLEYPNDGYTNLVNSTNTRIQIWKGIDFEGKNERVPIGVFRVDSVQQSNRGALAITGTSLEILVIEDRFIAPYTPTYGKSGTAEIAKLIQQSTNNALVYNRTVSDYKIRTTTPWARERWDAIDDLAEAIVADVYCAPDGSFVIANQPDFLFSPVQWVIDEGKNGVLVELNKSESREGVYNAVVASGQSNDSAIPPVSAAVYDLDPASPTYWNGGFGHVPKFYESQFLYTVKQCRDVAAGQLVEARGLNKTLTIGAVPNPALEPGDAVMVAMLDGTYEKHILQSFSIPLADGDWTAETLAVKAAGDDAAEALPMMINMLSQNKIRSMHNSRIPAIGV